MGSGTRGPSGSGAPAARTRSSRAQGRGHAAGSTPVDRPRVGPLVPGLRAARRSAGLPVDQDDIASVLEDRVDAPSDSDTGDHGLDGDLDLERLLPSPRARPRIARSSLARSSPSSGSGPVPVAADRRARSRQRPPVVAPDPREKAVPRRVSRGDGEAASDVGASAGKFVGVSGERDQVRGGPVIGARCGRRRPLALARPLRAGRQSPDPGRMPRAPPRAGGVGVPPTPRASTNAAPAPSTRVRSPPVRSAPAQAIPDCLEASPRFANAVSGLLDLQATTWGAGQRPEWLRQPRIRCRRVGSGTQDPTAIRRRSPPGLRAGSATALVGGLGRPDRRGEQKAVAGAGQRDVGEAALLLDASRPGRLPECLAPIVDLLRRLRGPPVEARQRRPVSAQVMGQGVDALRPRAVGRLPATGQCPSSQVDVVAVDRNVPSTSPGTATASPRAPWPAWTVRTWTAPGPPRWSRDRVPCSSSTAGGRARKPPRVGRSLDIENPAAISVNVSR